MSARDGPGILPKPEPEPEPERVLTPAEQVYAERYVDLLSCGIDPDQALRLIHINDIGNAALALHKKGCPPDLIVRILT